ncbi:MAG: hypothetical protein ACR2QB_12005 [Gammaproteobacteria bacterium]
MIIALALGLFFIVSFGLFAVLGSFWGLVATAATWIAMVVIYSRPIRTKTRHVAQ